MEGGCVVVVDMLVEEVVREGRMRSIWGGGWGWDGGVWGG